MDLSVKKLFKVHLRKQFEEWYANEASKQGPDLQAVLLSLSHLREEGAKWLINAASYISNNPQIVVTGFVRSGITHKLDSFPTGTSSDAQGKLFDVPGNGLDNHSKLRRDIIIDDEDPEESDDSSKSGSDDEPSTLTCVTALGSMYFIMHTCHHLHTYL